MDFVDGVSPSPASARLARWRLARAAARAVGLASLGITYVIGAVMTIGFLSSGDKRPWFHAAARIVFTVFMFSTLIACKVYVLLMLCVARSKIKEEEAAVTLKSVGTSSFMLHLFPAACAFLGIGFTLLEYLPAKGSLMETIGYGVLYVVIGGMLVFISCMLTAGIVVVICKKLWITWQCLSDQLLSQHSTEKRKASRRKRYMKMGKELQIEPSGESCEDGQ